MGSALNSVTFLSCRKSIQNHVDPRKEEAPVCIAYNTFITVKHILTECAELLEIRKKYFEEKSLYSLFRNVIPEIIFNFLREIGVFHKI